MPVLLLAILALLAVMLFPCLRGLRKRIARLDNPAKPGEAASPELVDIESGAAWATTFLLGGPIPLHDGPVCGTNAIIRTMTQPTLPSREKNAAHAATEAATGNGVVKQGGTTNLFVLARLAL